MELISSEEQLREENAQLRDLVERYHHHFAVGKLLQDGKLSEIGSWIIAGDKLQKEVETLLSSLK